MGCLGLGEVAWYVGLRGMRGYVDLCGILQSCAATEFCVTFGVQLARID